MIAEIGMGSLLSYNEREALSRFVLKLISDVEKVTALFESRGADASSSRAAQAHLQATLDYLQEEPQEEEIGCFPDNVEASPGIHVSPR